MKRLYSSLNHYWLFLISNLRPIVYLNEFCYLLKSVLEKSSYPEDLFCSVKTESFKKNTV